MWVAAGVRANFSPDWSTASQSKSAALQSTGCLKQYLAKEGPSANCPAIKVGTWTPKTKVTLITLPWMSRPCSPSHQSGSRNAGLAPHSSGRQECWSSSRPKVSPIHSLVACVSLKIYMVAKTSLLFQVRPKSGFINQFRRSKGIDCSFTQSFMTDIDV